MPLTADHTDDLYLASGGDSEIWRWFKVDMPQTRSEMRQIIKQLTDDQATGSKQVFTIVKNGGGNAIGWTTFYDLQTQIGCVQMGWSWIARSAWRTSCNTEVKLLMLEIAFEHLNLNRVQWRIDPSNQRSMKAIVKLGARQEGLAKQNQIRRDGTLRDTAYFALLKEEWPAAKQAILRRIQLDASGHQASTSHQNSRLSNVF